MVRGERGGFERGEQAPTRWPGSTGRAGAKRRSGTTGRAEATGRATAADRSRVARHGGRPLRRRRGSRRHDDATVLSRPWRRRWTRRPVRCWLAEFSQAIAWPCGHPTALQWVITSFAVYSAGAVLVPLNTRYKAEEAGHVLRTSRARLLFTTSDFLGADLVALLTGVAGLEVPRGEGRARRPRCARMHVVRGVLLEGGTRGAIRGRQAARRTRRRGRLGHHLHLRHDRKAQGRGARATARASGPTWRGPSWSACAEGTVTSSSTPSSTRPG